MLHVPKAVLKHAWEYMSESIKSGLSKFCGRQPLKNFKEYGLGYISIYLYLYLYILYLDR